jgi:hypothetical protein
VAVDTHHTYNYIFLIKYQIEPDFNPIPILTNFISSTIPSMRGIKRILGNNFLISSFSSTSYLYLLEIDPTTLTLIRLEAYSNFFPSSIPFF